MSGPAITPARAAKSAPKRLTDLFGAAVGLAVISPLLAVIGLIVLCTLGRPVLFRQTRPGISGKPFVMYKFRTMHGVPSAEDIGVADKARTSRFGAFLRASSLDELPELWNVLLGQMSLVGPRPLLTEYLPLYTQRQARRHAVRPGITGWAQVKGRNALSWEEKFDYDLWYVENWSYWLDWKILLLTVRQVLVREGVDASQEVTMEPFRGTERPAKGGGSDS